MMTQGTMMTTDNNMYPILLLVNYWEIHPSHIGTRLNELLKRGVSHFATFVPWQATESDISHALTRLLQAVAERRMTVSLILSPEVGIHFPHSGLPKDVVSHKENSAYHYPSDMAGKPGEVVVSLPPNLFALPSYFSSELSKRYYGFLSRMDGFFADLHKTQPGLLQSITVILSGSFWKYYRSPLLASQQAFGSPVGDYSAHAALAFRQRLEQFYAQREFTEPSPAAANRWKTRSMEEMNRKWFYQQSEDFFRLRSAQSLRKRTNELKIQEFEIFTPSADPYMTYSNFLQTIAGGGPYFSRLSSYLDEAASRISMFPSRPSFGAKSSFPAGIAPSFIHWSCVGGVKALPEAQRQFLFLKSLLLMGGQGGGVMIDDLEWFSFSPQFRTRTEALARSLFQGEMQARSRALYLTPHLWSGGGPLWNELVDELGSVARSFSSLDLLRHEKSVHLISAHLLIVDPTLVITQEVIQKLLAWARGGRILVLPQSQLYTEAARRELESRLQETKKIRVDVGLSYSLHSLGEGRLILFDVTDQLWMQGEPSASWKNFLKSVLSVAEMESGCKVKDKRVSALSFEMKKGNYGVFLLNGSRQAVKSDIVFPVEVQIGDLGSALSGAQSSHGAHSGTPSGTMALPLQRFSRFALDIPASGVLPLSVDGLNWADIKEQQLAAMTSQLTQENVFSTAASELPGFDSREEGLGELWS